MTASRMLGNEVVDALLERLLSDPKLVAALRRALGDGAAVRDEPEVLFCTLAKYAARTGLSRGRIETLLRAGLPSVGKRAGLRIDVERADAWIRAHFSNGEEVSPEEAAERGASGGRLRVIK